MTLINFKNEGFFMALANLFFSFITLLMGTPNFSDFNDDNRISNEIFFSTSQKSKPKISSNGKYLAYLSTNIKQPSSLNLYVKNLCDNTESKITDLNSETLLDYDWCLDGSIFYLTQDNDKNKFFLCDLENVKDKVLLLENKKIEVFSYDKNSSQDVILKVNDVELYKVDFKVKSITVLEKTLPFLKDYIIDNNQNISAAHFVFLDGNNVIKLKKEHNWENFITWKDDYISKVLGFGEDNKSLFVINSYGTDTSKLVEIDLETKKQKIISFNDRLDVFDVIINPVNKKVQAVCFYENKKIWDFKDEKFKTKLEHIQKRKSGNLSIISRDVDDRLWTVSFSYDDGPEDYFLVDTEKNKLKWLFSQNNILKQYRFVKPKAVSIDSFDGIKLKGYLLKPETKKNPNKAIIIVNSKKWEKTYNSFSALSQWLVGKGYLVLQLDSRGSVGYGKSYFMIGNHIENNQNNDLVDVKKWLVKNQAIDPLKIGIIGFELGGYEALNSMIFNPKEFVCGISLFAPLNLKLLLKNALSKDRWYLNYYLGSLDNEAFLNEKSLLFWLDNLQTSLMFVYNDQSFFLNKEDIDQAKEILNAKENCFVLDTAGEHTLSIDEIEMLDLFLSDKFNL
jgi:dipeptidyl aminopeptidase/acylaminoacyl peptidase